MPSAVFYAQWVLNKYAMMIIMSLLANTAVCRYVCTDPILEEIGQCNWLCQKRKNPTSRINHRNYGPRQTQLLCGLFFFQFFFLVVTPYVKWRPTGHMCQLIKLSPDKAGRQRYCWTLLETTLLPKHIDFGLLSSQTQSHTWTAGCGKVLRLLSPGRLPVIMESEDKARRVISVYSKEIQAEFFKYHILNSSCYL